MNIIIIGGGASGMFAGCHLKTSNTKVTIIEQNEKLGKKLYITGKGRCNITNDCDEETFLSNVVTNSKFLLKSIYTYNSQDVMNFFESNGLNLKVERGNRVFPLSDKSSDVIKTLKYVLDKKGVDIKLNERVESILYKNGVVCGVKTDKSSYTADKIIVATGGLTYSATGSKGDGYGFAKLSGHTVTKLYPVLTGLNLVGEEYKSVQGLSLKNVRLTAYNQNKVVFNEQGELLFTHYGISGPLVISCSSLIKTCPQNITLSVDLKPALNSDVLDKRLLRDFDNNKNKEFKHSLDELLPKSLIPLIIKRSGIKENLKVNSITQEQRQNLLETLKNLTFKVKSLRDESEAIITSGGVSVKEINPKSMESKIVGGLYFVGEVLDVDALTGGFNLQIAFSTAYTCAQSILENI